MKSVVEQFGELGVSKKMMAPVITASPQLLLRKPTEFHEVCNPILALYFLLPKFLVCYYLCKIVSVMTA